MELIPYRSRSAGSGKMMQMRPDPEPQNNEDVLKIIINEENILLALIMFPIVLFLLSFQNLASPFQDCF